MNRKGLFKFTGKAEAIIAKKKTKMTTGSTGRTLATKRYSKEKTNFSYFNQYLEIIGHKEIAKQLKIEEPYFKLTEKKLEKLITVNGHELLNFSSYNYLGFAGDKRVNLAAIRAICEYSTSVSASRMVSGEIPLIQKLEDKIARLYQSEASLVFVSGHATNVTTISTLFSKEDLILYDEHAHNSLLQGIQLSGASKKMFSHNKLDKLEEILKKERHLYEKVLIVAEGLYSMDGDAVDLRLLVSLKNAYGAFLMIDEAHSLGVLGEYGRGIFEEKNVNPNDIDIWMGTLSKTLAAAGGYIAGSQALITMLRYSGSGFVYSVGISPPVAAAALKALELLEEEPGRVKILQKNAQLFCKLARDTGLNLGMAQGYAIQTLMCKSSQNAVKLSNALFAKGIYALPIIYPAVSEKEARIRFFLSVHHIECDIQETLSIISGSHMHYL